MKRIALAVLFSVYVCVAARGQAAPSSSNPKVRAITGFVWLEQGTWEMQVAGTLVVLRKVKSEFEAQGYQVESLRITTQPLGELVKGMPEEQALAYLGQLDQLSGKESFDLNVGPAMMQDGDDPATLHVLQQALSTLPNIEASTIIADESGIHWKTIHQTAELVKYVAEHSPTRARDIQLYGHGHAETAGAVLSGVVSHGGRASNLRLGLKGRTLLRRYSRKDKGNAEAATADLTAALTKHAKVADQIGNKVAAETGWSYVGVDPTPAPLGDVSIAAAIEDFTGAKFGSSGTLTAARIITAAVKAVPVKQIGYSGLMVPVMEDKLMAQRWAEGTFNVDSLLAYSSVCGTGLDTIPLPGDVSVEQMERMYSDVASLAVKWNKPLSARLQPIPGKKAGDRTEFQDPFLFNTTLHPLP